MVGTLRGNFKDSNGLSSAGATNEVEDNVTDIYQVGVK